MSIATHYILTNNTGALITLPNFQTISPGLSAALSIHDYLLYCQYSQEFLQQVDNGDITVQYYTGATVIVPKPATASLRPIQEIYMPTDARLAFTAPVSGVAPTLDNHLTTRYYVESVALGASNPDNILLTGGCYRGNEICPDRTVEIIATQSGNLILKGGC